MSQQQLMTLIHQKDEMQKEIAKLTKQLQFIDGAKQYQKGLVDNQGFPRSDLDFGELCEYRNLKRKKAELNNDHSKLMKQIQKKLFQFHSNLPKNQQTQQYTEIKPNFSKIKEQKIKQKIEQKIEQIQQQSHKEIMHKEQKYIIQYLTPFARITLVEQNSPAALGNIKVNDLLSQFSQINIYTPNNIKQIPYQVKQGRQIKVVMMRPLLSDQQHQKYQKVFTLKDKKNYAKIQLKITPQKWSGRGLLGCKIDPI